MPDTLLYRYAVSMRPLYVFVFSVFFLAILAGCNSRNKGHGNTTPTIRKFTVYADSGIAQELVIHNKGQQTAEFALELNNGFYLDEKEIVQQIEKMAPEYPGEGLERKAWRYVIEHVKLNKELGPENWQHAPVIMINSIGNGQCDDLASTLNLIWKKLGFQSRVWNLEGHVVPEVFVNNKWQMFDPSHRVYYLNAKMEVAGVRELIENPKLITTPLKKNISGTENIIENVIAHSTMLAQLYATDTNNYVNDWYDYDFELKDNRFFIPAEAIMTLPMLSGKMAPLLNRRAPDYSFLSVQIAPTKKAEVEIPLVLYSIEGDGRVEVDGREFQINSKKLKKYLKDYSVFHHRLRFLQTSTPVKIYYLINTAAFSVLKESIVSMEGYQLDDVSVSVAGIAKQDTVVQAVNIDSILKVRLADYEKHKGQFDKEFTSIAPQLSLNDKVIAKIHLFVTYNAYIANADKSEMEKMLVLKVKPLLNKDLNSTKGQKLLAFLDDPRTFIVFLTYAEFATEKNLLKLLK